VKRKTS